MKTKAFFRYMARPINIFITVSILIFILMFFELIYIETAMTFPLEDISKLKPEGRDWGISRSEKCFMPNGRFLLVDKEDYTDRNTEKIYDSNYNKLWEGQKKDRPKEYDYLTWAEYKRGSIDKWYFNSMYKISPDMSKTMEIPIRQNSKIREIWRYQPKEDNFIGYVFKGEIIGYIGANGFNKSQTDVQPFGQLVTLNGSVPVDSENPVLLWQTDNRLYVIDFENRKTEILIDTGDKKITKIAYKDFNFGNLNLTPKIETKYRPMIEYRTDNDTINLLLYQPNEKITLKFPQDWKKYLRNEVRTAALKDTVFVCHSAGDILKPENFDKWSIKKQEMFRKSLPKKAINYSEELYKVDKNMNLVLINKFEWVRPANIPQKKQYPKDYVTIVSPPLFRLFNHTMESFPPNTLLTNGGITEGYLFMFQYMYPRKLTISIAVSVLMMLIALFHGWARCKNKVSLVLWIIFVGFFSLVGLITYLALNHTPLIKCPVCGKWRGLEKTNCIRCGAEFPEPKELAVINYPVA